MAFIRKQDPIAEAEKQVGDLTTQIEDAKRACAAADAAATSAVLAGKNADEAVNSAAKATAMLRALENAKAETDARVVELRRQHAEAESIATRQAAVPVMNSFADALDAAEAELAPLLSRYADLVLRGDRIIEFHCGAGALPAINALAAAARGPMKMLAGQLRGTADALLVDDEPTMRLAIAKRALAAQR